MANKDPISKLLWLDMEMTGLDVEKEVPIEVAALITDWNLISQAEFHQVIKQPQSYLESMDNWNKTHHKASGLLDQIPRGMPMAEVDKKMAQWIQTSFATEPAILCGNSISQDRLFIRKYMPLTEATLHYRMMDVTAWKVVFNGLYGRKFKKNDAHRALEDIRESIAEFKYYLSFVTPK
jgi:oligoribonuclease